MRNPKVLIAVLVIIIVGSIWLSGKTDCDRMNLRIAKAFKDDKFTVAEFEDLSTFVKRKKDKIADCNKELGDARDFEETLTSVIKSHPDFSKKIKLEFIKKQDEDFLAKLYLETSLSMYGYDNEKTSDFKNTLGNLLGEFKSRKRLLYTVNSTVNPAELSYEELIRNDNLFKKTKGAGNPGSTDFEMIFKQILSGTATGELAMLFSDLIISQNVAKTDNMGIISGSKLMIGNIFSQYSNDFSVLILKFNSQFLGTYFPYNDFKGKMYTGKRPFYVTIIARNQTMNNFLKDEKFNRTVNWANDEHFEGYEYFTKISRPVLPVYTIVIDREKRIGNYNQQRKEMKKETGYIHALEDVYCGKKGLEIPVDVNFSSIYLADSLIKNPANYKISGDFAIKDIQNLSDVDGYTHRITLRYLRDEFNAEDQEVQVELRKRFPIAQWVDQSNSFDDTDIGSLHFSTTTFGLKGLMAGIGQAYETPNKIYYKFSLTLNK